MCDEIIEEEIRTVATNFNEKQAICKAKRFYILLVFYCYFTVRKTETPISILHHKKRIKRSFA